MFQRLAGTILCLLLSAGIFATHNRAGEITYRQLNNLTYEVTVYTYTKESSPADRDSIELSWGDGTVVTIPRVQETSFGGDIKQNLYKGTHTYSGPSTYIISTIDLNRIADIVNINAGNSVNIAFYVETELIVLDPQFFGFNNTPVLLQFPIDYANIDHVFKHNPNAYDVDGDSLSYRLIPPKQDKNDEVPNYVLPDQVEPGPNNNIAIDALTGELTWDAPKLEGIYNIAIEITEYRNGFKIGSMVRDMQIIVLDKDNDPPDVFSVNDTCIVAGDTLFLEIAATDPDAGQVVTLTAAGGPFAVPSSPAIFPTAQGQGTDTVRSFFFWPTNCSHVRKFFYEVVFKAEDNFTFAGDTLPLVDLETWLITVIAPPPENLTATAVTGKIILEWDDPYECFSSSNFQGFTLWRKLGPSDTIVESCQVDLTDFGYQKIVIGLDEYTYEDTDVEAGFEYCYRVTADFADGGGEFPYNRVESKPSNEACEQLKQDLPIIKNIDVTATDATNGKIDIKWVKPKREDLDTVQNPGPYEYRLYRKTQSTNYLLVYAYSTGSFSTLSDTLFTDTLLNTTEEQYRYKMEFYVNDGTLLGTTKEATSIYLSLEPTDNQLTLAWEEEVPWFNHSYVVYRQIGQTALFDTLDTVDVPIYVDKGLRNGDTYCYFVKSIGTYGTEGIGELLNRSQIVCEMPVDNIPPCQPDFSVSSNCDLIADIPWTDANFRNIVKWVDLNDSCREDVFYYNIYFAKDTGSAPPILVNQLSAETKQYTHRDLFTSVAGCYIVTSVDTGGNESVKEKKICIDNCPLYKLPNVFTPDGDNANDLYTPFKTEDRFNYRFIDHVDFKVFNKWGELLFETQDPQINWDGRDKNGNELVEAVYYYGCDVFEVTLNGVVEREKPLKGYIHILRGND